MTKMDRPGITGDLYMYKEVLVKFFRFDHVGICIADLELKRDSNMVSQKKTFQRVLPWLMGIEKIVLLNLTH